MHRFPLLMAGLINILITTYSRWQNDTQSIKVSLKNRELVIVEAVEAWFHASGETQDMWTRVIIMCRNIKKTKSYVLGNNIFLYVRHMYCGPMHGRVHCWKDFITLLTFQRGPHGGKSSMWLFPRKLVSCLSHWSRPGWNGVSGAPGERKQIILAWSKQGLEWNFKLTRLWSYTRRSSSLKMLWLRQNLWLLMKVSTITTPVCLPLSSSIILNVTSLLRLSLLLL